jgi:hypothetical protein
VQIVFYVDMQVWSSEERSGWEMQTGIENHVKKKKGYFKDR